MPIGARIRILRKRQHRTLQEIADDCGFTKSLLCKIEKGGTTPPIATLSKIASSLGVATQDLLAETREQGPAFIPASDSSDKKLIKTAKGYRFHAFAVSRPDKSMQPYYFTAKKGGVKPSPLSHAGEEFVFVLQGEMKYRIGNVEYALKPGDALYFDSTEEHDFTPMTDEVRYLAVFTEEK
jgi:transcriptional regulator with XRE-family HTH domain